jgi:glycosyltransferase involved in cell wall biosynthesis
MKIIQVSEIDLPGRRFNGHDLQLMLNKSGYSTKQLVMTKLGKDENTLSIVSSQDSIQLRHDCIKMEENLSIQSFVYPFGEILREKEEFLDADIVHYHLLFNFFLSIFSFEKLANLKKTVWTLHDPWALTGHCVHPLDCESCFHGCKECNHLDRYSPLKENNAHEIWEMKRRIYQNIDVDIVVASRWMYELVKRSPLMRHFERIHLIPFGIDIQLFKKKKEYKKIRKELGVQENDFVVMFRQDNQEWKGLKYITEMMEKLPSGKNIVFLTVGKKGLLEKFKKKHKIIEFEWVEDSEKLVELYSASDLFLMPSVAESFGMMAIEAMSCSLPVIVSNNTALPDVTFAPKCGIAINQGDSKSLTKEVLDLYNNREKGKKLGQKGREIVEKEYDIRIHNKRMINLYKKIYKSK